MLDIGSRVEHRHRDTIAVVQIAFGAGCDPRSTLTDGCITAVDNRPRQHERSGQSSVLSDQHEVGTECTLEILDAIHRQAPEEHIDAGQRLGHLTAGRREFRCKIGRCRGQHDNHVHRGSGYGHTLFQVVCNPIVVAVVAAKRPR